MLSIYITNLGKYNEGELIGKWINLPISDDDLDEVLEEIGINEYYEETFITDYESEIDGIKVNEFDSIDELNEMAEMLDNLDKYDIEIVEALISEGYSVEDAIDKKDDVIVWSDCSDMEDVAYQYCEECGILDSIPDNLKSYFDYEAFGRDMSFEGHFIFTNSGNCVEVC